MNKPTSLTIPINILVVAGIVLLLVPLWSAQAECIAAGDRGAAIVDELHCAATPSPGAAEPTDGPPVLADQQTMGVEAVAPASFGYGVTAQLLGQPVTPLLNGIVGMRFDWVRQPVKWAEIEPAAGSYDWSQLDPIVDDVHVRGLHLLLVVSGTPAWARPAGADLLYDGPPADLNSLSTFLTALSGRYAGKVNAYQVWQDPNLIANWSSPAGPSAGEYVQLLQAAYQAIKANSAGAQVVSAGLYPTHQTDGGQIDDLEYLSIMYQAGFTAWCDAVGVHLDGTNNPPSAYMDEVAPTPSTFKGQSPYYFRHYEAIRQVMTQYGDEETPMWLTQVGWHALTLAPAGYEYAAGVTEEQQAEFLIRAFQMAEQTPYIRVMMVDNFNLSTVAPSTLAAGFSLMRSDWSARPALVQLAQIRQEQILSRAGITRPSARNRAPQLSVKPYLRQVSPEVTPLE